MLKKAAIERYFNLPVGKVASEKVVCNRKIKKRLAHLAGESARLTSRIYATGIHFIFQAAPLLAAFSHPSHVLVYAPADSFSCRLDAT
ncbi:hypothetical protein BTW28_05710 [Citrobacter freundii]|nr:hypothetical protein BTW28_05710 [Citrobacter freundii]